MGINTDGFAKEFLFHSLYHRTSVHDELDRLDLPNAVKAFASEVSAEVHSPGVIVAVLIYVGNRLQLYKDTGLETVLRTLAARTARQGVIDILKQEGAKEVGESAPPRFTLVENTAVLGDRSITRREVTVGEASDEPKQIDYTSMWTMVLALLEKAGGKVTFTEAELIELNTQKVLRTERTIEGETIVEVVDKPIKEES